jgi:hypothetical protein
MRRTCNICKAFSDTPNFAKIQDQVGVDTRYGTWIICKANCGHLLILEKIEDLLMLHP